MKQLPALVMLLATLLLAFASNILPLHAQQAVIIEGRTTSNTTVPVRVDASGVVSTNTTYSGTQSVNIGTMPNVTISSVPALTSTPTFSSITVSPSSVVQATSLNTGRRVLSFWNLSTTSDVCYGPTSAVSCTTNPHIQPNSPFFMTNNVFTTAFWFVGANSGASPVVAIIEGQ